MVSVGRGPVGPWPCWAQCGAPWLIHPCGMVDFPAGDHRRLRCLSHERQHPLAHDPVLHGRRDRLGRGRPLLAGRLGADGQCVGAALAAQGKSARVIAAEFGVGKDTGRRDLDALRRRAPPETEPVHTHAPLPATGAPDGARLELHRTTNRQELDTMARTRMTAWETVATAEHRRRDLPKTHGPQASCRSASRPPSPTAPSSRLGGRRDEPAPGTWPSPNRAAATGVVHELARTSGNTGRFHAVVAGPAGFAAAGLHASAPNLAAGGTTGGPKSPAATSPPSGRYVNSRHLCAVGSLAVPHAGAPCQVGREPLKVRALCLALQKSRTLW